MGWRDRGTESLLLEKLLFPPQPRENEGFVGEGSKVQPILARVRPMGSEV